MKNLITSLCILSMLVVFAIMHQPAGYLTSAEIKFWNGKEPHADAINAQYYLDKEPSLLYLDPGDAPYFFRSNSSCRYICPLPVQRDAPEWNLTMNSDYQEEYNCIMAYTGKYIVYDISNHNDGTVDWFKANFSHRLPITAKIQNEYELVYSGGWEIYQRK